MSRGEWTPRERLLAAVNLETPDRVPVTVRSIRPFEPQWASREERLKALIEWGVDEVMTVSPPWRYHPDVTVRSWREPASPGPIQHTQFDTPGGALHLSVQLTPDWMVDEAPLVSDEGWTMGLEPPVKSCDDLRALDYLLPDPRAMDIAEFRESASRARRVADERRTLLQGLMPGGPFETMSLLGARNALVLLYDDRELVEATLERVCRWSDQMLGVLLDAGVDIVYRSGCCETTDFWSPAVVRELFMPHLGRHARLCHEAGAWMHHFVQTGAMPFLEDYAALGVDILSSLDDQGAGAMDLAACKRKLQGRVCLWGGVNPRWPFEQGRPADARAEVLRVLRILAPGGGYALGPSGGFQLAAKPENIREYVRAGKELGRYPLELPEE